jgi:phage repressor protein C with HTH and peptisase S24 domain
MDWSSKITEIENRTGKNVAELSRLLDLNSRYIYELKAGKSKNPASSFVQSLYEKLGISPVWLFTGEGPMYLSEQTTQPAHEPPTHDAVPYMEEPRTQLQEGQGPLLLQPPGGYPALAGYSADVTVYQFRRGQPQMLQLDEPEPEGQVFIPLFTQPAAAGPGQEPTQVIEETERLIPIMHDLLGGRHPRSCGIVRVVGDSMSDLTLNNGDWAIFDQADRRGDGVFVISMYGETRIKRLQYRLADQKIVIASENARRYPEPETVPASAVESGNLVIHGRVFSWMHKHPH